MQQFTIKDIESLCGIKAHTLRIWEQRYSLFSPKRKQSNHRIYDNEDLKKLLRISFLYHNGWKISNIASLAEGEIIKEVNKAANDNPTYNAYIVQLLESIIDFDKQQVSKLLDHVVNKIGFEKCIIHVCYPLLIRIGMLWVTNNIIPAQEHFCSYIIQHRIIAETYNLPEKAATGNTVLLFCPHGEHHELPLFFIHYLLKKNGWNVIYLGANIKIPLLQQLTGAGHLTHLYLHVITNFTGFALDDYFEALCATFKDKKIIASGAAIRTLQRRFTNLTLLKSDKEIYTFIEGANQLLGST